MQSIFTKKPMNLISLYTAEATAQGGRSGGKVSTTDGLLSFNLDLPVELGGEAKSAINPEQLFACAWAASIADAIGFAAKQRNRVLHEIRVTAKITFGQFQDDGFGITVEFRIDLPELTRTEALELVAEMEHCCPYTKAFQNKGKPKITLI